jgi:uncharacterized protein YbjT (DUF2867 family)
MKSRDNIILVAGATGKQGGAVIRHLKGKEWKIRALTRNANSSAAQALAGEGIDVVQGDMNDPSSLDRAMEDAYGVFSVQNFWIVGAEVEIQQGKNMANAALRAGVQHFVYTSVGAAERKTGVVHFESKFVIEEHIRSIGLNATVLRPVGFMENYLIPHLRDRILKGKLVHPVAADKKQQLIPTDDIGAIAAAAFEEPDKFVGQSIEIASVELTNPEIAEIFGRVIGRPVRYKKLPMLLVRLFMGKELHQMFRWYNQAGYEADIPALRSSFPNVKLTSLEEWLLRVEWGERSTA